jgi:hypothetical protein
VQGTGLRVYNLGYSVSGFRFKGLGFRSLNVWFRV